MFSISDREMLKTPILIREREHNRVYLSLCTEINGGIWKLGFDPMELKNPFPGNEHIVQIWQGYEDRIFPFILQRYVSERLRWIKYHEVVDVGHLMSYNTTISDAILKALLIGEEPSFI
ncbi:hypothetical protein MKX01_036922 [Papaver californicum]|nr:hypothetical protein MKX01_036922 [Papaver californicum]